ncbi:MAG: hypothetical protein FWG87_11065 [Defluviitaleaceae bacterium]|nr:hypothetical protein [Defluviitaleaceae bacterium]
MSDVLAIEIAEKKANMQLTENGYTLEFEAEIISAAEEIDGELARGVARMYKSVAELFLDLDSDENDDIATAEEIREIEQARRELAVGDVASWDSIQWE